jgi:hypothetical protein
MNRSEPAARYVIRVSGVLDARWVAWFDGMALSVDGAETVIAGPVRDPAHLYGLLTKMRDLGLTLVELRRLPNAAPQP